MAAAAVATSPAVVPRDPHQDLLLSNLLAANAAPNSVVPAVTSEQIQAVNGLLQPATPHQLSAAAFINLCSLSNITGNQL